LQNQRKLKLKNKAVFFTKTNARVSKDANDFMFIKNCIINPDLSKVSGVAPHHWTIKDGEIVAMNKEEISHRENLIHEVGIINDAQYIEKDTIVVKEGILEKETIVEKKSKPIGMLLMLMCGIVLGIVINHYFLKGIF
jgi:hypothetical protein